MALRTYFFAIALLLPSFALADVVMPPPDDCPAGTEGSTCHGGPHCVAVECTNDDDCASGLECKSASFCIGSVNCAGNIPDGVDAAMYAREALAACDADCESCQSRSVCIPKAGTNDGGADSGCSTTAARGAVGFVFAGVSLVLLGFLLRRGKAA